MLYKTSTVLHLFFGAERYCLEFGEFRRKGLELDHEIGRKDSLPEIGNQLFGVGESHGGQYHDLS